MINKVHNLKSQIKLRKDLRQKQTKAELLLWQRIRNKQLGYKFRRQHGIGPYVVDFYCPKAKAIVEIDGDIHFYEQNIKADKQREEYLKSQGLIVKRYTNLDVIKNISNVLEDLRSFLIAKKPHPNPLLKKEREILC
ncbi:MAG: endonuclease domain-containing protein [Candidatus Portnoybacteria bacterium]|jgi:very-short-patch-repair endonuclease|nr:endonuclease domain-containing protein [Candidatus Portnoybacteria bacterium]